MITSAKIKFIFVKIDEVLECQWIKTIFRNMIYFLRFTATAWLKKLIKAIWNWDTLHACITKIKQRKIWTCFGNRLPQVSDDVPSQPDSRHQNDGKKNAKSKSVKTNNILFFLSSFTFKKVMYVLSTYVHVTVGSCGNQAFPEIPIRNVWAFQATGT